MKDKLLAELEELGVHPSGRKVRADKGQSRNNYKRSGAPRSDLGQSRETYTKTAAYHKKIFNTFLRGHTNPDGTGDNLMRDPNGIFPPNVTNYFKVTISRGMMYKTSTKRRNHPELLRWQWWMAEYKENSSEWVNRICKWYFIKPEDIELWTYTEWAWAYVKAISSRDNRATPTPIILSYNDYLDGVYGMPKFDDKGETIWLEV